MRSFWLPLLGAGVLAAGGSTIYQGKQTGELRRQSAVSQQEISAVRAQLAKSDSDLQTTLNSLNSLRDEMEQTQKETSASLANAQNLASRHADLAVSRIARSQAEQARQLQAELGKVRDSTTEASTKLDGVSSQVGSVRTGCGRPRSRTLNKLESRPAARARPGPGRDERSDRNQRATDPDAARSGKIVIYSSVSQSDKKTGSEKVGDIQVRLEKADTKRNRFTLELLADDKRVEKKDRTINEPVQFYTTKARQPPYELAVVNEVKKDRIIGYLATPKVTAALVIRHRSLRGKGGRYEYMTSGQPQRLRSSLPPILARRHHMTRGTRGEQGQSKRGNSAASFLATPPVPA